MVSSKITWLVLERKFPILIFIRIRMCMAFDGNQYKSNHRQDKTMAYHHKPSPMVKIKSISFWTK